MLINFTVDPDVFTRIEDLDERDRHMSIIDLWERFGQLVIPGNSESNSRFYEAFQNAPQKIQSLWRGPLKQYRKICGAVEFDEVLKGDVVPSPNPIFHDIALASLEHTRGFCWGLENDEYSKAISSKLEICRFGHERRTVLFARSIELSNKPIDTTYTPDRVWSERIKDLAMHSRVIVVSDRYAIKNFLESSQNNISGLERLLVKLNDLPSKTRRIVNIFSALPSQTKKDPDVYFEEICEHFKSITDRLNGFVNEVTLHLADDNQFGKIEHYRYLQFDQQHLLLLDTGVEPLSGSVVKRACTAFLVPWNSDSSNTYRENAQLIKNIIIYRNRF